MGVDPSLFPAADAEEINAAQGAGDLAEWRGLPRFEAAAQRITLVLAFDTPEERDALVEQLGLVIAKKTRGTMSAWWPPRPREDLSQLRFEGVEE